MIVFQDRIVRAVMGASGCDLRDDKASSLYEAEYEIAITFLRTLRAKGYDVRKRRAK